MVRTIVQAVSMRSKHDVLAAIGYPIYRTHTDREGVREQDDKGQD